MMLKSMQNILKIKIKLNYKYDCNCPTLLPQAITILNSDENLAVDGCKYVLVTEDRYKDMLDFFTKHFVPDEPMGKRYGYTTGDELLSIH